MKMANGVLCSNTIDNRQHLGNNYLFYYLLIKSILLSFKNTIYT